MTLFNKLYLIIIIFLLGFLIFNEPFFTIQKSIIIFSQFSFILLTGFILFKKKILIDVSIFTLFVLFLAWAIISIFFSFNKEASIWEVIRLLSFFALFITIYNFAKEDKRTIPTFLKWFTILSVIIVLDDLYFLVKNGGLISGVYLEGALAWHNQMGGYLLFVIPLLFSFFLSAKTTAKKFFIGFALFLSVMALFLTYSRGAWLSLFGAFLIFAPLLFQSIKKYRKAVIGAFIGIILVSIIITNPLKIIEKISTVKSDIIPSTRSVSGNLRTTVWANSLEMIEKSPFIGFGIGTFGSIYDSFQKDPWLYSKYAHNYFLELAAETGIPGLLFFIGIIGTAVYMIAFYSHSGKRGTSASRIVWIKRNPLYLGMLISLTASFFHAFVDIDFSRITLYSLFWIFLAFALALNAKKEKVIEIKGIRQLFYIIPILLMAVSFILSLSEQQFQKAQKSVLNLDFSKAETFAKKALLFNPYSSKTYYFLSQLEERKKNIEAAELYYKKSLSYFPLESKSYVKLGEIEFNKGNYKNAEKMYQKAIKLAPYGNISAYLYLADFYSKTKDAEKEQKIIDTAVYKAFSLNEAFKGFEYLYEANGQKDKLTDTYIKFIVMEINLHQPQKALKIIEIIKKYLNPKNSSLPFLEENVVK